MRLDLNLSAISKIAVFIVLLGTACSGGEQAENQLTGAEIGVDSSSAAVTLKRTGPVVLPEIEHRPWGEVQSWLRDAGIAVKNVYEIPNPLTGKLLKAEASGMRVRKGDTLFPGETISVWIGK